MMGDNEGRMNFGMDLYGAESSKVYKSDGIGFLPIIVAVMCVAIISVGLMVAMSTNDSIDGDMIDNHYRQAEYDYNIEYNSYNTGPCYSITFHANHDGYMRLYFGTANYPKCVDMMYHQGDNIYTLVRDSLPTKNRPFDIDFFDRL